MVRTYISKVDGEYYAYAGDMEKDQVYSIGADNPPGGGCWTARWKYSGILYVASPSPNRKAAVAKAKRHGDYDGEV